MTASLRAGRDRSRRDVTWPGRRPSPGSSDRRRKALGAAARRRPTTCRCAGRCRSCGGRASHARRLWAVAARAGTDRLLRDRRRRGHLRDARSRDGAVGVGDGRVGDRATARTAIFNRQLTWAVLGLVGLLRRAAGAPAVAASTRCPGPGGRAGGDGAAVRAGHRRRRSTTPEPGSRSATFSFQPSEFLKLAVVVVPRRPARRAPVNELSDVRRSLPPIAFLAMVAAGACLAQGDLGSAIVMCADRAGGRRSSAASRCRRCW